MKFVLTIFMIVFIPCVFSADLTDLFQKTYKNKSDLNKTESTFFSQFDFYLVPGILSESFIDDDNRSYLDLSFLTGNYFEGEFKTLTKKYHFSSERLSPSSLSVDETKNNIEKILNKSILNNRKSIFICHSLGGVSLLEELLEKPDYQKSVGGIFFMQSPFSGTPIADIILKNNGETKFLGPILAYLNLSPQTIEFLSTKHRTIFMNERAEEIKNLTKHIPVITLGGVANGHFSLFKPSLLLIKGESDGMVPFESSKLFDNDFVKLDGADHGELVVRIPFDNFNKEQLTETMLKMLFQKM
jgi:hypothetical protein